MFPVGPTADDTLSDKVATEKTSASKPLSIEEKTKILPFHSPIPSTVWFSNLTEHWNPVGSFRN